MERILEYLKEEFGIQTMEEFEAEYQKMEEIDIGLFA